MLEQRHLWVNCCRGMKAVAERIAKDYMREKMLKNAIIKDIHKQMEATQKWPTSKLGMIPAL